eukprot:TRINITY_DN1173_c0_g1_i12.p1 TRINITY_DN1173_c0_g1~~TRINITY_DN1173_c0_g1_i12.p1  ORF type:complete len:1032 (-),score=299.45 TRINITY_DN1173_c0_g1_i12:129-2813(-)
MGVPLSQDDVSEAGREMEIEEKEKSILPKQGKLPPIQKSTISPEQGFEESQLKKYPLTAHASFLKTGTKKLFNNPLDLPIPSEAPRSARSRAVSGGPTGLSSIDIKEELNRDKLDRIENKLKESQRFKAQALDQPEAIQKQKKSHLVFAEDSEELLRQSLSMVDSETKKVLKKAVPSPKQDEFTPRGIVPSLIADNGVKWKGTSETNFISQDIPSRVKLNPLPHLNPQIIGSPIISPQIKTANIREEQRRKKSSPSPIIMPTSFSPENNAEDSKRMVPSRTQLSESESLHSLPQDISNFTAKQAWGYLSKILGTNNNANDTFLCEIKQTKTGTVERRLNDDDIIDPSSQIVIRYKNEHKTPTNKVTKRILKPATPKTPQISPSSASVSEPSGTTPQVTVSISASENPEPQVQTNEKEPEEGKLTIKRKISKGSFKAIPFGETQPHNVMGAEKNKNLTLIQAFYLCDNGTSAFVTLAIENSCTAGDVCLTAVEQELLDIPNDRIQTSKFSLVEVNMEEISDGVVKSLNMDQKGLVALSNEELVVPLMKKWDVNKKYRLYVREEIQQSSSSEKRTASKSTAIVVDVSRESQNKIEAEQPEDSESYWINENELEWVNKISAGTFAKVYKAMYRGKLAAVKVLKGTLDEKTVKEFQKEFAILKKAKHENLVHFFGACFNQKLSLIMELCHKGTLVHVMMDPNVQFTWEMAFNFGVQACRGLHYLHTFTPQIIHRDLKSLNLLVTKDWEIRISDFGLSRFNTVSNNTTLGNLVGTMSHCAPEIFLGDKFTDKSDMFSMAMILWEMATKILTGSYQQPYSEYTWIAFDFQIIIQASQKQLRPSIPKGTPNSISDLIQMGWDGTPAKRPSALEMEKMFAHLQSMLVSDPTHFPPPVMKIGE